MKRRIPPKHLRAAGACQAHSEEAYYGRWGLCLMGCLALSYTSWVMCKGRLRMEEIIFSLKHYWRLGRSSRHFRRCYSFAGH
jgi:hypothetical protein